MMRLGILLLTASLWLLSVDSATAQVFRSASDDLSTLRDSVENGSESARRRRTQADEQAEKAETKACEPDEPVELPIFGEILGHGVIALIGGPFVLPHLALNDDLYDTTYFPDYPYDNDEGSLIVFKHRGDEGKDFASRLQVFNVTDFDDLNRVQFRLQADHANRIGVDTEAGWWQQKFPSGSDDLWLGDFNLTYRFAQSEHVQFRTGLGANWLADTGRSDIGINFTYQVDLFPVRPWTISALMDAGSLGHAGLFHGRTTFGVMLRQFEAFMGYDYFRLGDFQTHGLLSGVALHF